MIAHLCSRQTFQRFEREQEILRPKADPSNMYTVEASESFQMLQFGCCNPEF